MSLTSAMLTAQSSIAARSAEMAIASRNVANVSNPSYSRLEANVQSVVSSNGSVVYVSHASRMVDQAAFTATLNSGSMAVASGSYATMLDQLNPSGVEPYGTSTASAIGTLSEVLVAFGNDPSNQVLGQSVVNAANGLVGDLKQSSSELINARMEADAAMARAVDNINVILSDLEMLNDKIVTGTASGVDVNGLLDERDEMLKVLSEEIGIDVLHQDNNGIAIYTDSGVTLFEKSAREVTFTSSLSLSSGELGNNILVDGIAVAGPDASAPISGGAIAGYAKMRDETLVTMQTQLDEVAKALVDVFQEHEPAPGTASADGVFTIVAGAGDLISRLQVNSAVDPAQGGDVMLLRDGGINGASFVWNVDGNGGYSGLLNEYVDQLNDVYTFGPGTGLNTSSTLLEFATNRVSWFSAERTVATESAMMDATAFQSNAQMLSNSTGVNLDLEMQRLLTIETSYSASARLMSTIDNMFKDLLGAVS
ncbi:Flagellar hook-associated protein 1 [Pseudovibrio axinellae]|uniref:Flagellar hook-associated protein 1 n=1 Tax=Pseudovibrio axinellae TaxID=989403 RepID=A0A165XJA0_9HYPH|nr:flagellar hook-associated protein FlgK [Pseudovibrio axinellae]KZL17759.1 Flagellar hook-associated protein 1 [Pseudovibrio axinellae]SEP73759.1 flagellar hook-associated protein 1 FlgK [Pseudovibrio axinellae]